MPFRRKSHYIYGLAWLEAQLQAVWEVEWEGRSKYKSQSEMTLISCAIIALRWQTLPLPSHSIFHN